jgi:hypothetical protein
LAYILVLTFEIEDSMKMGGKNHEKNERKRIVKNNITRDG